MTERRAIPVYLSLEEAAECMSVSVKTIRRWIAAGTLPAYRCGKRAIRIKLDDLEAAPRKIPTASLRSIGPRSGDEGAHGRPGG
jgi:excisionase family DNA binding protein